MLVILRELDVLTFHEASFDSPEWGNFVCTTPLGLRSYTIDRVARVWRWVRIRGRCMSWKERTTGVAGDVEMSLGSAMIWARLWFHAEALGLI